MINAIEGVYHIDYYKAESRMVVGIAFGIAKVDFMGF